MVNVRLRRPGVFQGKWVAFLPGARVRRRTRFTCLRCRVDTADPGVAGWYYRRGEVWRWGAQLCPGCLATLQRAEPA